MITLDETNENGDGEAAVSDRPYANALIKTPRSPMDQFLRKEHLPLLKAGDLIDGSILDKKGTRLFVDLGPRGMGIVFGREYYNAQDVIKNLDIGDRVNAKVVESDNEDGYIELSLKDAGEERRWVDLKNLMESGEVLELPVKEANRGGLIIELKSVQGFLPTSQLSAKNYPRVEGGDKEKIFEELQKLVGQNLKIKVLDVSAGENKLIFTEKDLNQNEVREALAKYKIGDVVSGEITGVVDFGAFVKLDGDLNLEGLVHISEIDWALVEDPRSILKSGDKIQAKIIDIQGGKISLSLKALKEDPWLKIVEKYHKGDVVKGKVVKLNPFGAFVELGGLAGETADAASAGVRIQGLVHISEFGTETKMKEELEIGQEYNFKILMIDPAAHRMSLGILRQEKVEP